MTMSQATKEQLITAIITMLLTAINKWGVPAAKQLLSTALDSAGDVPELAALFEMFSGKTEADKEQLLIDIKGVCLPLAQDALECHTTDGWVDKNCNRIADRDEK